MYEVFADLHVDIIHDAKERLEKFLDVCRKDKIIPNGNSVRDLTF